MPSKLLVLCCANFTVKKLFITDIQLAQDHVLSMNIFLFVKPFTKLDTIMKLYIY